MESQLNSEELFNEQQLIKTLKTAVASSKHTLFSDSILFILWGTASFLGFIYNYLNSTILIPSRTQDFMTVAKSTIGVALVIFTIYYVFFRNKRVHTYTAISTRFVWIGIIIAHNLNVIVTRNFLSEVKLDLLHPLQMVLLGFALFVTGGIYRYYILSISGAIMWIGAILASNYELSTQLFIRGIADSICFIVPGVLMYLASKKQEHV